MVDCVFERASDSGCSSPTVHLRLRRSPVCSVTVCLAVVGVVLVLLGCARTSSNEPAGQSAEQHSQPAQVAVTISRQTTLLSWTTTPLVGSIARTLRMQSRKQTQMPTQGTSCIWP